MWIPVDTNDEMFCEMATRRPQKTGLPMTIWVDDGKWYQQSGHGKRIKFQLDPSEKNTNGFGVMDLNGVVLHPNRIKTLSAKDIKKVSNFVLNNQYALDKLSDMLIDIDDIWPFIIRGGEPASYEEISKLNLKVDELICE